MKLSSNPDENERNFPVADWLPNDFLVHSMVNLLPSPETEKQGRPDSRGKKIINLKEALALLQPTLVKLPIVDSPRYKKVVRGLDDDELVTMWEPLDFSSPSKAPGVSQEKVIEEIDHPETEPTEEELSRRNEMLVEIEQKLEQANVALVEAQAQAGMKLKEAQDEAEKIIATAHSTAEQVRKQAFEEGTYSARAQVEKQIEQITVMIKETQAWRSEILEHSEPTIIRMVQSIAKKLFGSGFILDASAIEQMVGRAINEANRLGNLRIYVNPEDHSLLLSLWQESDLVVNGQKIQLVPSQNVIRGGCFVEGEFGSVDSRIDMQLERLERELNSTLSNREQEKQKQTDFPPVEIISAENQPVIQTNLNDLEQVHLNIATDQLPSDTPLENYGFNPIAQPE